MTLAYGDQPVAALQTDGSLDARRQHLFAADVERMFHHRNPVTHYTREQTLHWLAWLAKQMVQRSQTVFYIERLQPAWLPNSWEWKWSSRLLFGLLSGSLFGLGVGPIFGLIFGLSVALGSGLIEMSDDITPAETVRWSLSTSSLIGGSVFGSVVGCAIEPRSGFAFGLVCGLLSAFLNGLSLGKLETKAVPNQGIRRSVRNALIFGLLGLGGGLGSGLIFGLIAGLSSGLVFGLAFGLIFGLIAGLTAGGKACLQHFVLRFFLVRNGSTPWNYPAFLNVAAEYLFLRKVGGGYLFVHRMLMEYFAALPEAGKREEYGGIVHIPAKIEVKTIREQGIKGLVTPREQ